MILTKKEIEDYQKNRYPYLFITEATEVRPGISSKGFLKLNENEWFFKVHWPDDPNMPGMLQVEALVQMASLAILTLPDNKGKAMYLTSASNLKFQKKIIPNNIFDMKTFIKSFKRGIALCEGVGMIDNEMACKADFTLILPDLIKLYKLR